jgi:hypothetical protein
VTLALLLGAPPTTDTSCTSATLLGEAAGVTVAGGTVAVAVGIARVAEGAGVAGDAGVGVSGAVGSSVLCAAFAGGTLVSVALVGGSTLGGGAAIAAVGPAGGAAWQPASKAPSNNTLANLSTSALPVVPSGCRSAQV